MADVAMGTLLKAVLMGGTPVELCACAVTSYVMLIDTYSNVFDKGESVGKDSVEEEGRTVEVVELEYRETYRTIRE